VEELHMTGEIADIHDICVNRHLAYFEFQKLQSKRKARGMIKA
jgi:hypothetical protein